MQKCSKGDWILYEQVLGWDAFQSGYNEKKNGDKDLGNPLPVLSPSSPSSLLSTAIQGGGDWSSWSLPF